MDPMTLTPDEFEQEVRRILVEEGVDLKSFRTNHLETIRGTDGDYVIDVTARFEALGAEFLVLIECKRQIAPIERETVQILADKMRSVRAHKGMVFSTARFRKGAIAYASENRIALVFLSDGLASYRTKAVGPVEEYPIWLPKTIGTLVTLSDEGNELYNFLGVIGPPEWKRKSEGFLLAYLSQ